MLDRLIDEVCNDRGPITSRELARRLDVPPSVLDGMVSVLANRGILVDGADDRPTGCSDSRCGSSCVGVERCAFITAVPPTHHVIIADPAR